MYGYIGKVLKVDLNSGRMRTEGLDPRLIEDYIGGRGIGIRLLYDLLPAGADPLSPQNPLIFATGPCTGTIAPFSSFFNVTTKGPLAGACLAAHSGGHFGPELKLAGLDVLVVTGRSEKPVYLSIDGGKTELRDASDLWGLDTYETTERLQERHPEARVAVIGPAGENLVRYAAIMNDRSRAAARGGTGAVMGSKRLKAIVVKGNPAGGGVKVANPEQLTQLLLEANSTVKQRAATFMRVGTPMVIDIADHTGILPTRNFQVGSFEGASLINADSLESRHKSRNKACFSCGMGCSNINRLHVCGSAPSDEDVDDFEGEGPEYETIFAFGANCGNADLPSIIRLNDRCNRLGLDTISTGAVLAYSMELYQRGIITGTDTGGLSLAWGNSEAMEEAVGLIASRSGFGGLMAEGTRRMAAEIGGDALRYAVHVKGLEPSGYEPRGTQGMALAFATSSRGACHLRATMYVPEVFQGKLDRFTLRGKAEPLIEMQNVFSVVDSLILCKFGTRQAFDNSPARLGEILESTVGKPCSGEDIRCVGDRVWNLEKIFNLREGLGRRDDYLPERFFEPVPEGPTQGRALDRDAFEEELMRYYHLRGWDDEGQPSPEKLAELGLAVS